MKKISVSKTLSVVLSLIIAIGSLPFVVGAKSFNPSNDKWEKIGCLWYHAVEGDTANAILSGYEDNENDDQSRIEIPDKVQFPGEDHERVVNRIEGNAFQNRSALKNIIIHCNKLMEIQGGAFTGTNVEKIVYTTPEGPYQPTVLVGAFTNSNFDLYYRKGETWNWSNFNAYITDEHKHKYTPGDGQVDYLIGELDRVQSVNIEGRI